MKIALFYHCLLFMGTPDNLLLNAVNIVREQMDQLKASGLLDAATKFHVGINGGLESLEVSRLVIPSKASITLHGLQCHSECRTIRALEEWLPGHEDWFVLYFHSKNSSHVTDTGTGLPWRKCMMRHCITNWRTCVADLDKGYEAVGCHWMEPPATPRGQFIFAGTFFWARASFLLTLPSIMERERIKLSGIDSLDSRYEAEVWLGNGPRVPRVKDYHGPDWTPGKIATCTA
jgi:hypothetical protein